MSHNRCRRLYIRIEYQKLVAWHSWYISTITCSLLLFQPNLRLIIFIYLCFVIICCPNFLIISKTLFITGMWSCWLYAEFSSCSVMKMIVIMMMVVQRFSQFINLLCSRWNPGFYGVAQNHSYEDHFHAYGSIKIYKRKIILFCLYYKCSDIVKLFVPHGIVVLNFKIVS